MANRMDILSQLEGSEKGILFLLFFFILCAEAMSSLIHQASREGLISGFPIARGGTNINHLFFADDSLLFCKAKV